MPAFRMKLAITSLWDKTSDEHTAQKWFAFDNYIDYMRANNITNTAVVVTKMKFDPNVAYPKILFSGDRWLTPEELDVVRPRTTSDEVKKLISGTFTPASGDGVDKDDEAAGDIATVAATPPKAAPKPATRKAAAPPPADDEEEVTITVPAQKVADDDDDGAEIILPGTTRGGSAKPAATRASTKPATTPVGAPPPAAAGVSAEVASLLATWGNEE
jgi:hypothetical protein